MRTSILWTTTAAALFCALASSVVAKTFELPDNKPIVTIDLPNAWSPEEIEKGAQATSPDTSV